MATNPYFITARQLDSNGVMQDVTITISPAQLSSLQLVNVPGSYAPANNNVVAEAITANDDGLTTAIISNASTHVTVTSSGSTKIVTLPTEVVGKVLVINVGANGFKLRTSSPTTIGINGGTGSAVVSAIAASSTCVLVCVSATSWKGFYLDADSDVAKVAAAG